MVLNKYSILVGAFLSSTLSTIAYAEMFKCKSQSGQIEFSDRPCLGISSSQRVVSIRDNTLDSSAERQYLQQRKVDNVDSDNRKVIVVSNPTAMRSGNISTCTQARQDWIEAKKSAKCWATQACETDLTRELAKRVDRFCNRNADEMSSAQLQEATRHKKEAEERSERELTRPKIIASCDHGGCWDTSGNRYNSGAGNTFFSSNGACRKTGNQMQCP